MFLVDTRLYAWVILENGEMLMFGTEYYKNQKNV